MHAPHTHTHTIYKRDPGGGASSLAVSRTEERRGSETEELEECALNVIGTAAPLHSAGCQHENSRIFPSAHVRCRAQRERERERSASSIAIEASAVFSVANLFPSLLLLARPARFGRCASYFSAICIVGQEGYRGSLSPENLRLSPHFPEASSNFDPSRRSERLTCASLVENKQTFVVL